MIATTEDNLAAGQLTSMTPYIVRFALSYALLAAAVALLVTLLQIEGSAMGIITLMVAVQPAMMLFVDHHNRLMVKRERLRFAGFGTLAAMAVTALLFVAFQVAFLGLEKLPQRAAKFYQMLDGSATIALMVMAFIALLYFAVLYFATSMLGKQALKAHQTKAQAKA
jgi:hypothetical protein